MGGRFDDGRMPFSFARALSWVSLVLILTSSIVLSVVISNNARETLLRKQQDFAILLAENLNHQIYRRFTLPTLIGFGRVALRQPVQYERLDQVIQSTIHGLHVARLRIYDHSKVVSYSSDRSELGRTDLAPPDTDEALQGDEPSFDIVPGISFWRVMFLLDQEPGSYMLRTIYPLRIENRQSSLDNDGAVMGVLEFTQDITGDLGTVMRFQWLIVLTSLVSSVVLFALLQMFIRRAERIFAERVQEKQRLERELHQHEKLASMGRVIASIAHEIRNPLGIIRSSAELLLKRAANGGGSGGGGNNGSGGISGSNGSGGSNGSRASNGDAMSRRILEAIYDESMRLSQTVNDFLDYARPRKPREDAVEVGLVLDQVLTFLEPELERRGVTIARDTAADLWTTGDKDLLYRAFYNIMVNGVQAMDGPGGITMQGRALPDDGVVEVSFRDSGPGFDQNTRAKLLDPFFTTKENGTGLGLPIVNSIVTSHGGTLQLDNAPEGGAIVTVRLPAVQNGRTPTQP
ncbi:sensor histidine kinase [Nitratidesulfovibrio vulgaris]|uniref:histidine kinase n=1 Tax=Nitratidesulfovibrio vulgaris (strain DP4) TaxID=391774 RepID=A0A0H3A5D1_NITV4|nr:ATP-binding protein [Nitratidesulfovibrio vulgaris]ABM27191.1 integral membrane sensor signal transduction histidine kinase [Nitratidesulfovibrio vulgaris DP4]GEB78695.1 two-component sensor histidine kinase [Desulfovibrio desulfuricans]